MLEQGQIIKMPSAGLAEVLSVNESRAHVKLLTKTDKHIHTAFGEDVNFASSGREIDISPNSEVEVINYQSSIENNK